VRRISVQTPDHSEHIGPLPAAKLRSLASKAFKVFCRSASVALAMWAVILAAGCMGGAIPSTMPGSAASNLAPGKPRTVIDLLHNIKLVTQSGLLLRRDFYADTNLSQYFGGVDVKVVRSDNETTGDILGFDELVPPMPFDGTSSLPGMSIRFSWYEHTGGNIESTLSVRFGSSSGVAFDDVVLVFGSTWKKAPLEPPIPHRIYDKTTRPHGNEVIIYEFRTARVIQVMRVEFRGDATLDSIYIKGRKQG
jgi:hypothetical protein